MGLDIYLHTREQAERNDQHNAASEAFYGRDDYDALTEDEKRIQRESMPEYAHYTDVPSERYPDHLFNRRYLRSSYNGGGFNHAVPQMLGQASEESYPNEHGSLYWIFEPMGREWDGDDGALTSADLDKLRASKARALEVADALRKSDRLRVTTVDFNPFMAPPTHSDDDALRMYREAVTQGRVKDGEWWGSRDMQVFGGGVEILAAIPGAGPLRSPGVHLIYRAANEAIDSYIQSAEIVAEFCDESIALIERDGSARMSWSG